MTGDSEYASPLVRRGKGTDVFVVQEDNVILINTEQASQLADALSEVVDNE